MLLRLVLAFACAASGLAVPLGADERVLRRLQSSQVTCIATPDSPICQVPGSESGCRARSDCRVQGSVCSCSVPASCSPNDLLSPCPFLRDGQCDEGTVCRPGTDASDCQRYSRPPPCPSVPADDFGDDYGDDDDWVVLAAVFLNAYCKLAFCCIPVAIIRVMLKPRGSVTAKEKVDLCCIVSTIGIFVAFGAVVTGTTRTGLIITAVYAVCFCGASDEFVGCLNEPIVLPNKGEQCVIVHRSKMRADASIRSDEVGFAEQGQLAEVLDTKTTKKKDKRVQLRLQSGQVGWINAMKTKEGESVPTLAPAATAAVAPVAPGQPDAAHATTRSDFDANANPVVPQGESMYG